MVATSPDKDKAQLTQRLFAEIELQAKNHNFAKADALREKLMEHDSMALTEILKSADIIEREKTAGLDQDHLATWAALYEGMTEEERNCLFYSMKKIVVPAKKVILKHGSYNQKLFLINKGQVTVYHPKDGKNVVIAQLGRGDMLGEYTFTTISLCSASVVSHSEVELMVLDSAAGDDWSDQQPTLYSKLINFCETGGKIDQIIKQKQMEKRDHDRYEIKGISQATVLNKEGKKTANVFKGSLSNISTVGCCVDIRCSKKETARALLAQPLFMQFLIEHGGKQNKLSAIGKVVRVSFHLHSDYSVHVKFLKEIPEEKLRSIIPIK